MEQKHKKICTDVSDSSFGVCTLAETKFRAWVDLPEDLLEIITEGVSYTTMVRFSSVSKNLLNFRLAFQNHRLRRRSRLPWLLSIDQATPNLYRLHDPSLKRTFTISLQKLPYPLNIIVTDLTDLKICDSNSGWLLLLYVVSTNFYIFFLFNPFTKQITTLPPLTIKAESSSTVATFSSHDRSVYFLNDRGHRFHNRHVIDISTWRPGDKDWTSHTFDRSSEACCDSDFVSNFVANAYCISHAVFLGGVLYCSNPRGTLWGFGADEEGQYYWRVVCNGSVTDFGANLVEADGELLLLNVVNCLGTCDRVYGFDFGSERWVEKEGLEKWVVFDNGCKEYWLAVGATTKELKEMKNRVYFHGEEGSFYRSCKASRSYKCTKSYGWLAAASCKKFWIEPPPY